MCVREARSALVNERKESPGSGEHEEEGEGSSPPGDVDIEGYIVFIPSLLRYGCVFCARAGMSAQSALPWVIDATDAGRDRNTASSREGSQSKMRMKLMLYATEPHHFTVTASRRGRRQQN